MVRTTDFHSVNTSSILVKSTIDTIAQQVEQYTFNVWVLGSNPNGITNNIGSVVQRIEHKISNLSVAGSIPARVTISLDGGIGRHI